MELVTGGPGESWPVAGETLAFGGIGKPAFVCERACTSNWSRAVALGAHMSRSQKLERLRSRSNYWTNSVSEPSCWKGPNFTYLYTYSR